MLHAPLLPSSLADIGSPAKEAFQLALDTSTHGLTLVRRPSRAVVVLTCQTQVGHEAQAGCAAAGGQR